MTYSVRQMLTSILFAALLLLPVPTVAEDFSKLCTKDSSLPPIEISHPKQSKGAIIIIHGLNIRPSVMDEIGKFTKQLGFSTYRLSLVGHLEDQLLGGGKEIWLKQVLDAWCQAKQAGSKKITLLGFSMGGALSVNFVDRYPQIAIDRMILFAPAIDIQGFANLVYPLLWMRYFGWSLPSFVPENYRSSSTTSFDNYNGLLDLEDGSQDLQNLKHVESIPTLIFQDPDDSLVSYTGLSSWLKARNFKNWRVVEINQETDISFLLNHVIIDEKSAGPAAWDTIKREIIKFLS